MEGRARKPTMLAGTRGTILAGTRVRQPCRGTIDAGVSFAPGSARVLLVSARGSARALLVSARGIGRNQLVPEAWQARIVRIARRAQRRDVSGGRGTDGGVKLHVAPGAFATMVEAKEAQRLVGGCAPQKRMWGP